MRARDLKTSPIWMKLDCFFGKRPTKVFIPKERTELERITLALTASMMGEKLKTLVIGKAQKPRCFAFNLCFISKQIKK